MRAKVMVTCDQLECKTKVSGDMVELRKVRVGVRLCMSALKTGLLGRPDR
jgi:hypothetical protein